MKHIKKFNKFSIIGDDIIDVKDNIELMEINSLKNTLNEGIKIDIGENVIKVIPGKDKIYLNHKFDR